jgi:hypothetical protein
VKGQEPVERGEIQFSATEPDQQIGNDSSIPWSFAPEKRKSTRG